MPKLINQECLYLVYKSSTKFSSELKEKSYYKWHGVFSYKRKNYMIFRNIIQDLIESKHIRFPNKNKIVRVGKNLFSLN